MPTYHSNPSVMGLVHTLTLYMAQCCVWSNFRLEDFQSTSHSGQSDRTWRCEIGQFYCRKSFKWIYGLLFREETLIVREPNHVLDCTSSFVTTKSDKVYWCQILAHRNASKCSTSTSLMSCIYQFYWFLCIYHSFNHWYVLIKVRQHYMLLHLVIASI